MNEFHRPALVSVVLCALNAAETIGAQMDSLAAQTYSGPWELIFVDDGSTDGTNDIVRTYEDRVRTRIVTSPEPGSHPRAMNFGSRAAAGDLLVYCDADDVADPRWLEEMVDAADGFAAVGGHLEEERLNDPLVREWRPRVTDGDLPQAFGKVKVPVGANCAVWKRVFDEVGGYDEALTFTGIEVDFFWRVVLAGHEIRYAPDAVMHYRHRDSCKGLRRQAFTYGRGNIMLYERFRSVGLGTTSVRESGRLAWMVARGAPGAILSKRRRGAWMRFTWYLMGQVTESCQRRVWHLG